MSKIQDLEKRVEELEKIIHNKVPKKSFFRDFFLSFFVVLSIIFWLVVLFLLFSQAYSYPGTLIYQIVILIVIAAIVGVGIIFYRSRKK